MIVGELPDFALMPKSSSLFRLPGIFDYDTLVSRPYVEFFTYSAPAAACAGGRIGTGPPTSTFPAGRPR